mgnify:CR=1 FL=1
MMKFFKKLIKLVAIIVGAYAAFNTFFLAKMGASRIKRQIRLQYPDRKIDDDFWTFALNVDSAAIDEMEEEDEAWKEYRKGFNK